MDRTVIAILPTEIERPVRMALQTTFGYKDVTVKLEKLTEIIPMNYGDEEEMKMIVGQSMDKLNEVLDAKQEEDEVYLIAAGSPILMIYAYDKLNARLGGKFKLLVFERGLKRYVEYNPDWSRIF